LDKNFEKNFQFDFCTGQIFYSLNCIFIELLYILRSYKWSQTTCKKLKFWSIFRVIFSIRLIRGSTYTRVDLYASIYGMYLSRTVAEVRHFRKCQRGSAFAKATRKCLYCREISENAWFHTMFTKFLFPFLSTDF
jgi:hypothetical protein